MEMAGQIGWSPHTFWQSSFAELYHMHRGWLVSQGVDPEKEDESMSRDQFEELRKQLPDG